MTRAAPSSCLAEKHDGRFDPAAERLGNPQPERNAFAFDEFGQGRIGGPRHLVPGRGHA